MAQWGTVGRLVCVCLALAGLAAADVEVTTNRNDAARTGANLKETILTTANVNASTFGKLFTRTVDGSIYAQPLYLPQVAMAGQGTHNVVYVVTEHNGVYAFDADVAADSAPLWYVNLGPAVPSDDICQGVADLPFCPYTDLVPEIGITATPVIDNTTGTLYVVAKSKDDAGYQFTLHALDVASGAEKFGGPVPIAASVPGTGAGSSNGTLTFDALHHLNRPGLLLLNRVIYIAFGAVGDVPPYHGWVLGYDARTLRQVAVLNTSPNGEAAGIWAGGVGLAADRNSIYLTTGNGTFDADSGGPDLGSSFIRLDASRGLALADYFTPNNQGFLTSADLDVGSGAPVLLPDANLLMGVGKDGILRLVNRHQFGKYNPAFNNDVQEFQATPIFMGAPVYWKGSAGPAIYLWGAGDYLKQYVLAGGELQTPARSQGSIFAPPGAYNTVALSLSANGNAPGSGIVWAVMPYSGDPSGNQGMLLAFDAADATHELWDSSQNSQRDALGALAKFSPPTVVNGKVYAPTFSQQLVVYGLTSGDFTVKAEPDVITPAGQSASTALKIIPQANGLTSPVSLSCSNLPPGTRCTFSPSVLPAGSDPMQATLTVATTAATAQSQDLRRFLPATWTLLAGLFAAPLAGGRRKRTLWILALAVTLSFALAAIACGGGGSTSVAGPAPAPVASSALPSGTFTVVATSGGIEHRSTITIGGR